MAKRKAAIRRGCQQFHRNIWGRHALRTPKPNWNAIALGKSFLGLGNSSAMWVTPSGVPIVNAPLRTPVRNATPLLHPVWLLQYVQTKEYLERSFSMAARTMMVNRP